MKIISTLVLITLVSFTLAAEFTTTINMAQIVNSNGDNINLKSDGVDIATASENMIIYKRELSSEEFEEVSTKVALNKCISAKIQDKTLSIIVEYNDVDAKSSNIRRGEFGDAYRFAINNENDTCGLNILTSKVSAGKEDFYNTVSKALGL